MVSFFSFGMVGGCTSMAFSFVWKQQRHHSLQRVFAVSCTFLGCPISWHRIELGRQVRWIGLDINFFSCFWQMPKDKKRQSPSNHPKGVSTRSKKLNVPIWNDVGAFQLEVSVDQDLSVIVAEAINDDDVKQRLVSIVFTRA